MPDKLSNLFIRIMLGIFMGLLSLGVLLGTFGKLESPSYIFFLFLAAGFLLLCAGVSMVPTMWCLPLLPSG